jgi:hypothetical protein
MKTKTTYENFTKIHMKPEQKVCEKCGTKLKFYAWLIKKFVVTLASVFLVKSESQRCPNEECENHKNKVTYSSTEGHKYALKKSTFGLDVVAYVGFKRIKENKNYEEIHKDLNDKGIKISRRNVDYLYKSFEYLIKCSLPEQLKCLKKEFDKNDGIILSIDGLQPQTGSDLLFVLRDTITGEVLHAVVTHNSDTKTMEDILKIIKKSDIKVKGIVSDGQQAIRKAVELVFPGIPYQLCTFHYFKDLGKPVGEADKSLRVALKKNLKG